MISIYRPKIQLVLFDFDGTLVDTAPDLIRATNIYLKSQGVAAVPEGRIRREIGMGLRRLIADLYPAQIKDAQLRKKIEQEFIEVYSREFLASPRLFDGALEFLKEFEGRVAIVSNKSERFIKPILKHLGLNDIPWVAIVGGDTYARMKPHPEPFMKVIEAANMTPEETLIVGDGIPDALGAAAIGSRMVAVEFGYTSHEELLNLGATCSIPAFEDLLPVIESLNDNVAHPPGRPKLTLAPG